MRRSNSHRSGGPPSIDPVRRRRHRRRPRCPTAAVAAIPPGAVVIAADGALDHALAAGLTPAGLVGDLDSITDDGLDVGASSTPRSSATGPTRTTPTPSWRCAWRPTSTPTRLIMIGAGDRLDHQLAAIGALGQPSLTSIPAIEAWWGDAPPPRRPRARPGDARRRRRHHALAARAARRRAPACAISGVRGRSPTPTSPRSSGTASATSRTEHARRRAGVDRRADGRQHRAASMPARRRRAMMRRRIALGQRRG